MTSLLVSPVNAYIDTLILPRSQFRAVACIRSFGSDGRMKPVTLCSWPGGYGFHPFNVTTTDLDFPFSRHVTGKASKGCSIGAVWTPHIQETLVSGVLQGRKQTDPRGASALSTSRMWESMRHMYNGLDVDRFVCRAAISDYRQLKRSSAIKDRQKVKTTVKDVALHAWGERPD